MDQIKNSRPWRSVIGETGRHYPREPRRDGLCAVSRGEPISEGMSDC